MTVRSPTTVRRAAVLVALEGIAGVLAAVVYVVSGVRGGDEPGPEPVRHGRLFRDHRRCGAGGGLGVVDGPPLGAWRGRVRPAAAAAGGVVSRRRFGAVDLRHRVAVVALVTLVLLFSPSAVQWLSTQDSDGAASADSSGPDTR